MTASPKQSSLPSSDLMGRRARWPPCAGLLKRPVALERLFDSIPVGIVILDRDRNIVFSNQASQSLTGYSRQEAIGIGCKYIVRSRTCDRNCPLAKLDADSEGVSVETDIINRNRQRISVRVTSAPLADTDGNLVGYIESIEDIQLLKKLDTQVGQDPAFGRIIGQSPAMRKIFHVLPAIASTDSSVLITGETGTGKDFLAEAIHNASERAAGSFIKVNCGALPETLMESELFGHVKGAFTGAVENKPGRFKLAHNGTLYLTEIGDLPLQAQVKLLMFLDDQIVFPIGGVKGFRINARVIAGTHRNLEAMAKEGRFREDLLFRLNVVRLHLPPLRERRDDTALFMDHFLAAMVERLNKRITGFSPEARKVLTEYEYPGNVRELRNLIEYAANVCEGPKIEVQHIPSYVILGPASSLSTSAADEEDEQPSGTTGPAPSHRGNETWADVERRMIIEALIKAGGKKKEAADLLGWGRSTLWRKIKKHGIEAERGPYS